MRDLVDVVIVVMYLSVGTGVFALTLPVGALLHALGLVLSVEVALCLHGVGGDGRHGRRALRGRGSRAPGRLIWLFGPRPPPRLGPVPRPRTV